MEQQYIDDLGRLADKCDNLFHAAQLPMPAEFHKGQLTEAMAEIRDELRRIYISIADENPWG